MKKLIYTSSVIFALVFASCDMNDKNADRFNSQPETGWIQFADDEPREVIYGDQPSIALPVELYAATNKGGIEVSYTITDVTGNSTAIIPERTGSFVLQFDDLGEGTLDGDLIIPIDNTVGLTSNVEFDVTITGTSKAGVEVGLSDDSKPTTIRVKICSFNVGTTYAGTAVASLGNVGPAYTVTMVPVEGEVNTYSVPSAWGAGFVPSLTGNPANVFPYPAIVTINPDYTVDVVGVNAPNTNRYQGGEGTYDPCSDTFNITLRQGVFANPFTVDVVWSPVAN